MTDAVLGGICMFAGAMVALAGAAIFVLGLVTFYMGHGGGWWIAELFYILVGGGLAFIGFYAGRYGLGLLRQGKA